MANEFKAKNGLIVAGSATVSGGVTVNSTTETTSNTTGALVVSGGIASAKTVRAQNLVTSNSVIAGTYISSPEINAGGWIYAGTLGSEYSSDTGTTNSEPLLYTFSLSITTSVKLLVEVRRDSDGAKRMSEVLVLASDSVQQPWVKYVEYGILNSDTENIGYCEAYINGGTSINIHFVRTGTWSTQNCTYKVVVVGTMPTV